MVLATLVGGGWLGRANPYLFTKDSNKIRVFVTIVIESVWRYLLDGIHLSLLFFHSPLSCFGFILFTAHGPLISDLFSSVLTLSHRWGKPSVFEYICFGYVDRYEDQDEKRGRDSEYYIHNSLLSVLFWVRDLCVMVGVWADCTAMFVYTCRLDIYVGRQVYNEIIQTLVVQLSDNRNMPIPSELRVGVR